MNCAVETRAVHDTVTISAAAQPIECHTHVRADPPPGNDDTLEPAAQAGGTALDERDERVLTHLDLIDCVE